MKILLLIDNHHMVSQSIYTAAEKLGLQIDIVNGEGLLAEQMAPSIAALGSNYKYILTAATSFGKDVMPRIAALLDAPQISEVIEVVDAHTFKRPIYAGNAIETVKVDAPVTCMTIRQSAFARAANVPEANVQITPAETSTKLVSVENTPSTRPELGAAKIVISGGRGVGSKEGFHQLEEIADKLGAALGASRAAVDAGYAPNDYQVGQTGKVVAPELYIAIGISGAIQHIAGMKESKVIVAINKDENAPIFEVADYGLVADLNTALPELKALL